MVAGVGMLLVGFPPVANDGLVLLERARPFSQRVVDVAKEHEGLAVWLEKMLATSIYVALGTEVAIMLASIMHNHNVIPGELDDRLKASGLIVDTTTTAAQLQQAMQAQMLAQMQAEQQTQQSQAAQGLNAGNPYTSDNVSFMPGVPVNA